MLTPLDLDEFLKILMLYQIITSMLNMVIHMELYTMYQDFLFFLMSTRKYAHIQREKEAWLFPKEKFFLW